MTISVHARIDHDLVPLWEALGRSAWFNRLLREIATGQIANPVPVVIGGVVMRRIYDAMPGDWRAISERTGLGRNSLTGPLCRLKAAGLIHVSHRLRGDAPLRYWYERGPGPAVDPDDTPIITLPGLAENSDRRQRSQRKAVSEAPAVNRDPLMALYGRKMK
jgi:hypothetical protein